VAISPTYVQGENRGGEAHGEKREHREKISLDFQDADIGPIFRLLADVNDYNLVNLNLSKRIVDRIFLTFTVENVFNEIFDSYGEEGSVLAGYGRVYNLGINYKLSLSKNP
jgi:outer membrane receptor protein involved in Fe transport